MIDHKTKHRMSNYLTREEVLEINSAADSNRRWNELEIVMPHPVLADLPTDHAYFVHSYQLQAADESDVIARTQYGGPVTAAVAKDNMVGTQFHPEKSQALGLALIRNFLQWKP